MNSCLRRTLVALHVGATVLVTSTVLTACKKEPDRWEQAAEAPLPEKPTTVAEAEKPGGALNAAFPSDGVEGYSRVFTQEKEGFAEAKLEKDGQTAATLAISDAVADDTVKAKFAKATDTLEGYPLVTVGKNQSALLVRDRYQVKVSSQTLDADGRKAILSKFNLKALASR